jgi:hypothetical protein
MPWWTGESGLYGVPSASEPGRFNGGDIHSRRVMSCDVEIR